MNRARSKRVVSRHGVAVNRRIVFELIFIEPISLERTSKELKRQTTGNINAYIVTES